MAAGAISEADVLKTVLCALAASTGLLGGALWLTGKLHLTTMVQYLPMPVVGGKIQPA